MGGPLMIAYRTLTRGVSPFAPLLLYWRRRLGKEDPGRMRERLGFAGQSPGGKPVAWLHGASVGEGLALMPLVERLAERGFEVLVTTGTVTSASVIGRRLPAGAVHQYAPLDTPLFWRRFLDHWRPSLVLLAESELWPNMIDAAAARGTPIILVNARLSERSFRRWLKAPRAIGDLLSRIDLCLAQTQEDAGRLVHLGAPRVQVAGNLKYDASAPPAPAGQLATISALIGSRPVWVAASTHEGEERIAMEVHRALAGRFPLITIVAPRHPERGPAIAAMARAAGIETGLRSAGDEIGPRTTFYIADTVGEMGLFYRLASVVFLGKSLAAGGGQNPIEPAKLGCAILHGPQVANFAEVYRELDRAGGAMEVGDADTLARALAMLFSDSAHLRQMARAASDAVDSFTGATGNIIGALEPYLMQMRMERE
jgi:3-deoxy-D-manno-octulosonic-acid transferase